MSVFRVRKVAFINFGLLFIFLSCWMSWYIYPLAKSFFVEAVMCLQNLSMKLFEGYK